MKKKKPQYRWMIKSVSGYLIHSYAEFARKDCISNFVVFYSVKGLHRDFHRDWKQWYRQGYRCVKVELKEVK